MGAPDGGIRTWDVLPLAQQQTSSDLGGDHCSGRRLCHTGCQPHTNLAGTNPMSPDSATDVIISDKRLIGQHTMPFSLIKELSRKAPNSHKALSAKQSAVTIICQLKLLGEPL